MTRLLWLIGGTQESAELAIALVQSGVPCIVTVVTETARCLYPVHPNLKIWVGRLGSEQLPWFLQEHQVCAILDASHPFAVEVSKLAIAASTQIQIPYLRYERLALSVPKAPEKLLAPAETYVDFETLLSGQLLTGQRVLLTVGYRPLELFRPWQERATLFARILPSSTALNAALAAGFTPDRMIALRPPVAAELERALWQQWQISMVVTKASGTPGGEDVKRRIAAELGVRLVAIERPLVNYPQQTSDLNQALEFCCQYGLPPG
jgi:precorrin-6A/cobalt-precorrin-6A reductase